MDKGVGPVAQATKSDKASKRLTPKRRSGIFLLEPRVMYDGAAAPTVAAATHHHDHAHNPDDPQGGPVDHAFHGFTPHGNSQGTGNPEPTHNFSAPTTVTPGAEPNGHAPGGNVVFVDSQIANYQAIVSAISPGTTVFVFDGTKDGLQQIAQDLQGMHGLHSVDIISHGAADEVLVGTDTLTTSTIPTYAADLTAIGKALAPHGQLDLYGCDVAAGGDGLLEALQQATGRNVAASTGPVGAAVLGGTWTLDATTGPTPDALPANLAALQSFDGLLATTTPQIFFDTWNGEDGGVQGEGNMVEQLTVNGSTLVNSNTVINDGSALNTSGPNPALTSTSGFVVDTALNEYFIASYNALTHTWTIQEGSLSGGGLTTLYTDPFPSLTSNNTPGGGPITGTAVTLGGLALDAKNGELYFAQDAENYQTGAYVPADTGIYKISVTGGPATLVTSTTAGLSNPLYLTLDTADNLVFFDDSILAGGGFPAVNNLDVANLTTGAVTVLKSFNSSDPNFGLQGMDIDTVNHKLYLATADFGDNTSSSNAILSFNLSVSGSGSTATASVGAATTLFSGSGAFQPTDIVVDPQAGIFYTTGSAAYTSSIDGAGSDAAVFEGSLSGGSALTEVFAVSTVLPAPTLNTGDAAMFTHAPQLFLSIPSSPPVVAAGATVTFDGGGSAVALDSGLTITAGTSTTLASATVTLTSGELSSDILSFNGGTNTETFSDGDKITAAYSAGALTLSGTATVADYQTALDQVQFSTTSNADPTNGGSDTSRTISWAVTDTASLNSVAVTSSLTTHEPPTVTAGASVTVIGGGSAAILDSGLSVADVDSGGDLTGAIVKIASGFVAGDDTLSFTNQSGITGTYSNGTLTLSGTATLAQYQTALESIKFSTISTSAGSRTIDWSVKDAASSSAHVTSTVAVEAGPSVTAGGTVTFTGGSTTPVATDPGLTISDPDGATDLTGATVTISNSLISGDMLNFTTQNGITGSYTNGVLTLTGNATIAQYQTALESVTYNFTADGDPTGGGTHTTRTISWQVTDTLATSAAATSTLDTVHVAPVLVAGNTATFTGGGAAVTLDGALTVSDVDSGGNLAGASVSIGAGFISNADSLNFINQNGITGSYDAVHGVLTLSGSASVANYQSALDSITYSFNPANGDPTGSGGDTTRTISYVVNDGVASSAGATSTLDTVHVAPTLTAGATATFTGGGSPVTLDGALTVTDADSGDKLTGATVTIASGFLTGDTLNFTTQNGITGVYSNGTLTLSGNATVEQYQTALQSVTFSDGNNDPTGGGSDTTRTISWTVKDGSTSNGTAAATSTLDTVHVAPTVTAGGTVTFIGGGSPTVLDSNLTLNDVDSGGNLTGATVTIGSGFIANADMLNFTNQNGISGSYDAVHGVLTLTGTATVAQYQAALQSVTFSDGNNDPTGGGADTARTISWQVNDGNLSNTSTSTLDTVHVAPTVTAGATATFTGGGSPVALDSTLTVSDVDSGGNLSGASVQIVGFVNGEVLNFTNQNGISEASYANGVLTLTGTATIGQYQAALRSVTFSFNPANADPTFGNTNTQQSIDWVVNDGNSVNGTNKTFPSVQAINNDQPSLGLNQLVVENGIFPSRDGGGDGGGIPLGSIRTFAGSDPFDGAQPANGQLLPIDIYQALFSILGTTYGGNGQSNFELPNLGGTLGVGFGGNSNFPLGYSFGTDQFTLTTQNLPHGVGGSGFPFDNDQPSQTVNYIINVGGAFSGNSTDVLGEVVPFLGNFAPTGYMFASGQLLSIQANQALFSLLGTTYGGNGTTTFALPDLDGKTIVGAGSDGFRTVLPGTTTGQDTTTLANSNLPFPLGGDLPVSNDQPSVALTYLVATSGLFPSNSSLSPNTPYLGEVIAYAGTGGGLSNMLAEGWSVANGQTLSIAQNQPLFSLLGTSYGGNGTTTFNLPDLVGRSIAGVGTNADGTTVSLGEAYGTDSFTLRSNNLPLPAVATSTLDLVHAPPTVTAGTTASFEGGGSPVQIDPTLAVSDPDSGDHLTGATVKISSGFIAGDTLNFTAQNGISEASYSNGVLTLTGNATVEQYQTALESITYGFNPANGDPTAGNTDTARTISYTVNDGVASSAAATSTLDTVHVAPNIVAGASVTFTAGGSPVALDSGLIVSDPDSSDQLTGATVKIDNGFLLGDSLNFTNQNGISGSYSNGALTLTGTATVEQYQAALDSITFSTTNNIATSHTIDWTVKDSESSSILETSSVAVQVGPILTAGATATFIGGSTNSGPLDPGLTISDLDGAAGLTGATVTISSGLISGDTLNFTPQNGITEASYSNGVLTLTGTATVAQYQTALESVTFSDGNNDPTGGGTRTTRTISWQATDSLSLTSPAVTSTLETVHAPPFVGAGNTATFTGGATPVTLNGVLTVTDADSGDKLTGATVTIASGFLTGDTLNFTTQNGITGVYSNGTLTLSGNATVEQYQSALDSVSYSFSPGNGDPTGGGTHTTRTISWTVNDGNTSNNTATATSTLDTVHAPPVVVAGNTATFTGGSTTPVTLDGALTVTDADSGDKLTGATVTIASGFIANADTLNFTNQNGITGSYDAVHGVLTLTGTATQAQYQAALDSISYSFTAGGDPTGGGGDTARTISWTVSDGSTSNGSATDTSTLTTVHVPPTVTAGGAATFTGGTASSGPLNGTLTVAVVDSGGDLAGATVSITSGLLSGDTLNFTNQNGISGRYDAVHGVLTLTGNATKTQYEAALESITYSFAPANGDPTGGGGDAARTISWTVNDGNTGNGTSAAVTSTLITVHVPATIATDAPVTFTENGPAVPIDGTLAVNDVDSNELLTGATVKITSGLLPGDTLSANTAGSAITASYSNGVLTLTGTDTIADYRAVLQSVSFSSSGPNPTSDGADPSRTISWSVNDGASTTTATGSVKVSAVPTVVAGADVSLQALSTNSVVLDPAIGVFDDTPLTGATVTIAGGFQSGDVLAANTANTAITASYANGVLTLTGTDTAQHYQAVLASVTLSSSQTQSGPTTIDWQIADQKGRTSAVATSTVEISGNLVPPPTNPVANPLPATTVVNNPVAEFSGLVTNAVAGGGEAQTVGLGAGLGVPGVVHVIHSDVTASIDPDGAVAFNLPLIPLEAVLGGDVVSVTASLADGQPLPAWLHFDTQNGQFAGLLPDDSNIATGSLEPDAGIPGQLRDPNVPAIVPQSITIEVIARDSKGNMSITDFTIDLSVRTPPKHGWNTAPGHNAFAHWGMLQGATPVLSGEPMLWHHGLAPDIDRDGLVHAAEHVPAGRVGFSEQLKVHGLHALNADRAALMKNLQHIAWR